MNEPTREEMLEFFEFLCKESSVVNREFYADGHEETWLLIDTIDFLSPQNQMMVNAIRTLIEQKPKVSREFIRSWAEAIMDDSNLGIMHVNYLCEEMLRQAGLEVSNERKEESRTL